jgi:hypothetical protein
MADQLLENNRMMTQKVQEVVAVIQKVWNKSKENTSGDAKNTEDTNP